MDDALSDEELMKQLKSRFQDSVPLKHIDIVLVQSWQELVVDDQEQNQEEGE